MKKRIAWFLLGVVVMQACNQNPSKNSNEKASTNTLHIIATTGMVADAIQNIVQDKAQVTALMGPGVDPHLYKATQGDLTKLTNADIVFYNGLHLEGKMQEIFEKMGRTKPVYALTDGLNTSELKSLGEEATEKYVYDPHIWFNIELWSKTLKGITEQLSKVDTKNADFYKANYTSYEKSLQDLHQEVIQKINSLPLKQRTLITSHDAFGYMADAYGLEVKALQGINTADEFGLQDVKQLVDFIVEKKLKSIFVESSVPRKPIEAVVAGCIDKGHHITIGGELFSDAMGANGTAEGTYIGMVKHNVNTIVNALK